MPNFRRLERSERSYDRTTTGSPCGALQVPRLAGGVIGDRKILYLRCEAAGGGGGQVEKGLPLLRPFYVSILFPLLFTYDTISFFFSSIMHVAPVMHKYRFVTRSQNYLDCIRL